MGSIAKAATFGPGHPSAWTPGRVCRRRGRTATAAVGVRARPSERVGQGSTRRVVGHLDRHHGPVFNRVAWGGAGIWLACPQRPRGGASGTRHGAVNVDHGGAGAADEMVVIVADRSSYSADELAGRVCGRDLLGPAFPKCRNGPDAAPRVVGKLVSCGVQAGRTTRRAGGRYAVTSRRCRRRRRFASSFTANRQVTLLGPGQMAGWIE